MELISNEEKIPRALLVSVDTGNFDAEASMDELFELVKSAGAEPAFSVIQKLQKPESATFVGSGKLEEIKNVCDSEELDLIIADSELSPTQIKNIENYTGVRVIDRTTLILDIFALRARSKEGKLQVELAQLKYMLPRLTGKGIEMSRLGGGIGTKPTGGTSAGGLKRLRMSLMRLKSTDKCSGTGAKRTALSPARLSATQTPESQL